jgi:KDO2-lipid IV(A) lauroyltransferase
MAINLQRILNGRLGVAFTVLLARLLPPAVGYKFSYFVTDQVVSRKNLGLVRALRINQWVVNGENLSSEELDEAVKNTLRHTAHCLYDTYHYFQNERAGREMVIIPPEAWTMLERIKHEGKGVIIVGPHLSNFDFVGQVAAGTEIDALALAIPQPGGGYRWQNQIRRYSGLKVVPTSLKTMRRARKVLDEGGIVMTAIDRPIEGSKHLVDFFGRSAELPLHHILLALKSNVPIIVAAVVMNSDGRYDVVYSDPVTMDRCGDRDSELVHNGERILNIAEKFIRLAPNQWSMYYPVWPEIEYQLP